MRTLLLATAMTLCTLNPAVSVAATAPAANPFFAEWKTPYALPPFRSIREEHYLPAFKEGMARQKKEIERIVNDPKAPDFGNTIAALDASGQFLGRVSRVFFGLNSAETNDRMQAIETEVAPLLARHSDDLRLNPALFRRVQAVWDKRDKIGLTGEQQRLLEHTYLGFVRAGARLSDADQVRMRAINQELSLLSVQFSDNVLKETNAFRLVIDKREDLAGLPENLVATAADVAKREGKEGKWVFTLHAPSLWPFLHYAHNRDLRRQMLSAYLARGDHGDALDNKERLARIAALRVEKAQLLGYRSWADFVLERTMAKNAQSVNRLLDQLWQPALAVAKREAADLQAMIDAEKGGFSLEPWDWRFYSEKVRKARFDLDDGELRPYFAVDRVRAGAFLLANKLYGLNFVERSDLPTYHDEVRAYEVREKDGRLVGIFYADDHPRPGKRGGAWCGSYRQAWNRDGQRVEPVVVNVGNYSRGSGGKPALLSLEEVETVFHEFGHALHALLGTSRFRSGNMPPDFVELPSQIMENWATEPEFLRLYAFHHASGQVIPDTLIEKIRQSRHFNQGFETVEYLAAAKLDMDWHTLTEAKPVDTAAFEKASVERMGLMREIPLRYRSPYFVHIVGGYDAGYYGYIWSGVLDTDAFEAFKEKGNLFDPDTARSFRKNVLEPGFGREPGEMYRAFRGRDPVVGPLLKKRGLQ